MLDGSLGFGGEESAGASFLRRDGTVWTTDKDGIILDLLAAEMTARTGKDPGEHYRELTARVRRPVLRAHRRPGHPGAKDMLKSFRRGGQGSELAGEKIPAKLTAAPGNGARSAG